MSDKVKLSKDGSSIDFVQSDSLPTTLKKFRQSPEVEGFYRFVFENDLRAEAFGILDRIVTARKAKKIAEKAALKEKEREMRNLAKAAANAAANAKKVLSAAKKIDKQKSEPLAKKAKGKSLVEKAASSPKAKGSSGKVAGPIRSGKKLKKSSLSPVPVSKLKDKEKPLSKARSGGKKTHRSKSLAVNKSSSKTASSAVPAKKSKKH